MTTYWYSRLKPSAVPPPGIGRASGCGIVIVMSRPLTVAVAGSTTGESPPPEIWSTALTSRLRRASVPPDGSPAAQTAWEADSVSVTVRSLPMAARFSPGTVMVQLSVVCGRYCTPSTVTVGC